MLLYTVLRWPTSLFCTCCIHYIVLCANYVLCIHVGMYSACILVGIWYICWSPISTNATMYIMHYSRTKCAVSCHYVCVRPQLGVSVQAIPNRMNSNMQYHHEGVGG